MSGQDLLVTYTVMPGKNADITLNTDVINFSMEGIDIAAIPYSMDMDMPETDELLDGFSQLSEAIADLHEGVGELEKGSGLLVSGFNELGQGSDDIKSGLSELVKNSTALIEGSSQIGEGLSAILVGLDASAGDSGNQFESMIENIPLILHTLRQLAEGMEDISGNLSLLASGFSPAYAALGQAISAMPETVIDQTQLGGLAALVANNPT